MQKIYNLIILDASGSMSSIETQAINGFNETVQTIRAAQEKHPEQQHTVTLVVFNSAETKTVYDGVPVAEAKEMTAEDFHPDCCTPLFDAMGFSINTLRKKVETNDTVLVTVITDGEDHEGGALEAAQAAKKKGMNVFILGVGDTKGSPIPDGQGGYMRDAAGNIVMTALNEDMCQQIAQAGSGKYIHVDNTSDAQEALNDELIRLQKGETDSVVYSEYDEQFQAFGILVLLLLIIETIILESKNPLTQKWSLFKRNKKTKQS